MKNVFTPPMNIANRDYGKSSIFLGGTIDMGNSHNWQEDTIKYIESYHPQKYNIFNPRRLDWDSNWEQSFENPHFYQQVNWELDALEAAEFVLIYFMKGSQSPISLLELGLMASDFHRLSVICEDGYFRKGNVEIVCNRYQIQMFQTIEDWVNEL